jgi:hypothetical protein
MRPASEPQGKLAGETFPPFALSCAGGREVVRGEHIRQKNQGKRQP